MGCCVVPGEGNREKLVDKIILIDDPGPGFTQSFNRQVISFNEGLKHCGGDLIAACRADFELRKNLFNFWDNIPQDNNGIMKVFEHRVLTGNMMTIHPEKTNPIDSYFRVSDWLHLGKKKDLEKWAGILETAKFLYHGVKGNDYINSNEYRIDSFGTEQVWFISLLNKYLSEKLTLENYMHTDLKLVLFAIINNFYILNTRSTMGAYNLNWDFQPEFHPIYMTECEYKSIFNSYYGK
jgi:hypothetical protein